MGVNGLISLTAAAALLGRRRGGKRTHASTLHRWANKGLRGIRLTTVRAGGVVCTTESDLEEFFRQLSANGATASDRETAASNPEALIDAKLAAKRLK